METLRYKRASIRETPWGYQADIVRMGKRFRKTFGPECDPKALRAAKDYIDTIDIEAAAGARPLSAAEIEQARQAIALLPPSVSILDAVRDYLQRQGPARVEMLLSEAAEEYIANKEALRLRPAAIRSARAQARRLAKGFPEQIVSSLTLSGLESWLAGLKQNPVTRNNTIRDISGFLNWCVARGYAATNPASGLEEAMTDATLPVIYPVETVEAYLRHLEGAAPTIIPSAVIGFFAGVRVEEMDRMTSDNIMGNTIHVTPADSKTRQFRLIEMEPNLCAWLEAYPFQGPIAPFGPKVLAKARKAAGLHPWLHNVMRHSFATFHLAKYRDAARTAHDLGHPNANLLYSTYRTLAARADGEKFFNILPKPT